MAMMLPNPRHIQVPSQYVTERYNRSAIQPGSLAHKIYTAHPELLSVTGFTLPSNDPYQSIQNFQTRLSSMGYDVPEPKKPSGLLHGILNALKWVDSKTGGPVRALLNEGMKGSGQAWRKAGQVFMGRAEAPSGTDLFDTAFGTKPKSEQTGLYKFGRGLAGFGIDVLTDPTTYLSFGAKPMLQRLATEGVEAATRRAVQAGLMDAGDKLGREVLSELLSHSQRQLKDHGRGVARAVASERKNIKNQIRYILGDEGMDILERAGGMEAMEAVAARLRAIPGGRTRVADIRESLARKLEHFGVEASKANAITQSLTRRSQHVMDSFLDVFGGNLTVDVIEGSLTSASRSMGRVSSVTNQIRGLSRVEGVVKAHKNEMELLSTLKELKAAPTETAKLIAMADKGDLHLYIGIPFTDKRIPVFELTPVKEFTGRQIRNLMARSPAVRTLVEALGTTFNPRYVKFSQKYLSPLARREELLRRVEAGRKVDPETIARVTEIGNTGITPMGVELQEAANRLSRYQTQIRSIPQQAVREAVDRIDTSDSGMEQILKAAYHALNATPEGKRVLKIAGVTTADMMATAAALGPGVVRDEKLMRAATYYIERTINDKAAAKWLEVAEGLTPDQIIRIQQVAAKNNLMAEITRQIDKQVLRESPHLKELLQDYERLAGQYVHHLYLTSPEEGIRTLELMTQGQRVRAKTAVKHRAMHHRQFDTLAEAIEAGYEVVDYLPALMAARMAYSRRALATAQLLADLKAMPSVVATHRAPAGWRELTDAFNPEGSFASLSKLISSMRGYYVHPEVARHIRTLDRIFTSDEAFNTWQSWLAQVTNHIKGFQLTSLSFVIRNFIGEAFQSFVAGATPEDVAMAARMLRGAETVTVGNRTLNVADELAEMARRGVFQGGAVRGDFARSGVETILAEADHVARGNAERIIRFGKWEGGSVGKIAKSAWDTVAEPIRSAGDFGDRLWRTATYLAHRRRGMSMADAAQSVRKFHVDYSDLTAIERNLFRHIVPYYTYSRKNLPIMLRLLFENPFIYSGLGHLVDNASNALGNPELSPYLEESLALPLYKTKDGNTIVLNWRLPVEDLARIKNPFTKEGWLPHMSSLNPILTTPLQLASNRSWSTGRDIMKYEGDIASGAKFVLGQFGMPGRGLSESGLVETMLGLADEPDTQSYRPHQLPWWTTLSSLLPIQNELSVNVAKAYRYRDELEGVTRRLQAQGKFVPTMEQVGRFVPYVMQGRLPLEYSLAPEPAPKAPRARRRYPR